MYVEVGDIQSNPYWSAHGHLKSEQPLNVHYDFLPTYISAEIGPLIVVHRPIDRCEAYGSFPLSLQYMNVKQKAPKSN